MSKISTHVCKNEQFTLKATNFIDNLIISHTNRFCEYFHLKQKKISGADLLETGVAFFTMFVCENFF